eukprot:CAMPEP_0181313142 /NCGR_PEP_ID=MMETSP1101-20121128/14090_1 /TAXON_ID=46948 /ORGANISM="Rhodomonas abbreviata, Strain Caron Lab Isolate" /LENGTH=598 /DNA_ID=CAMNT_0023420075 /DNA_START=275 /DNA_END=2068 /DNA_ORIENTATION=+
MITVDEPQSSCYFEALPQMDGAEFAFGATKLSKNAKKKMKKKEKKQEKKEQPAAEKGGVPIQYFPDGTGAPEGVEIEYVADSMVSEDDPMYNDWIKIFEHFQKEPEKEEEADKTKQMAEKAPVKQEEKKKVVEDEDSDDEKEKEKALSRKKYKALHRLSIAELKQLVKRPDVVEVWDVTASDPRLLVYLKSYRNTVPVPRHWCNKRKYLQGKRGIEKVPFQLPDFIEATGIAKLRAAYEEKENEKTAKQKARAQSRPKMSKMDIDYQVLHDAFFRFQTKPRLSTHGELYYEGKEFEVQMKEKRPGTLSDELKTALGMPSEGVPVPPPWLINMQRYGPPPCYPNLKIQGLNAPIPTGAQFGYHPGGWGKPPVDEFGRPIYGDVFGTAEDVAPMPDDVPIEKQWWGDIKEEDIEEEEEEEEEEEVAEEEAEEGITSVTGYETPASSGIESIELRKNTMSVGGTETPDSSVGGDFNLRKGKALYTVMQQEENKVGGDIMGSSFKYNITDPTALAAAAAKKDKRHVDLIRNQTTAGVEVTIDASELENMDESLLQEKYENTLAGQKASREDVSDVYEEQAKKRKKQQQGKDKGNKKYKEYAW